jgi:RecB family exonuclease
MAEPVALSASSVNTYLRCGYQWYLAYVMQIKSPPSLKQARGISVHAAIEVNMTQKKESQRDLPIQDVLDAYRTSFAKTAEDVPEQSKIGEFTDSGVALTRKYQVEVSPGIQPIWVEEPVAFDLAVARPDDSTLIIPWTGSVDLVDSYGRVRDTKTTSRKPHGADYKLNMTGYALGYRHFTGQIEDEIILDYLVATKKPYYYPVKSGGPVPGEDLRAFSATAETVIKGITAGSFPPNGVQSNACSWCGYRSRCPYVSRTISPEEE